MKRFILSVLQSIFGVFNLELRKKPPVVHEQHYNQPMKIGLERLRKLNLPIATIVDVGAASGVWSISAKHFWPDASYVLFEPLEERAEVLKNLVNANKNFYYVPFAAGKDDTTISFTVASDLDGSGVTADDAPDSRKVKVTSIQKELRSLNLNGPLLIKLDTHGFEVPILEGCEKIWDQAAVFIIECYGFQIAKDSLLFHEMCTYMANRGFRLWDIIDIMNRPTDGAFWQCDAFFISDKHPLFKNNTYNG